MRASDSGVPPNIRPSRVVTRQRAYELPAHKLLERFVQLRAQPIELRDELLLVIDRKIIEHIKLMERTYFHKYRDPKYIDMRIDLFKGGFVQQHVLTAHFADGAEVRMPICVVGYVKDRRITRINEYLTMGPSKLSDVPDYLP